MKKTTLLLLSIALFWSCQKKEYPTHSYQNSVSYLGQNKSVAPSLAQPDLLVFGEEGFTETMGKLKVSGNENREKVEVAGKPFQVVEQEVSPNKQEEILDKKNRKATKSTFPTHTKKATKAKENRAIKKPGLTSLLLSGGGLFMAILTLALPGPFWLFVLAFLAGTAGLVLGISTLSRIKRQKAPASGKGLAIAGIVLGAIAFLAGLFVLYAYIVIASVFGA